MLEPFADRTPGHRLWLRQLYSLKSYKITEQIYVDFDCEWITNHLSPSFTHIYPSPWQYVVSIVWCIRAHAHSSPFATVPLVRPSVGMLKGCSVIDGQKYLIVRATHSTVCCSSRPATAPASSRVRKAPASRCHLSHTIPHARREGWAPPPARAHLSVSFFLWLVRRHSPRFIDRSLLLVSMDSTEHEGELYSILQTIVGGVFGSIFAQEGKHVPLDTPLRVSQFYKPLVTELEAQSSCNIAGVFQEQFSDRAEFHTPSSVVLRLLKNDAERLTSLSELTSDNHDGNRSVLDEQGMSFTGRFSSCFTNLSRACV